MNIHDEQKLVDTMQQCAHVLHKNGRDVLKIFEVTRDLNRALAAEAIKIDLLKFKPISRPLKEIDFLDEEENEYVRQSVYSGAQ